MSQDAPAPRHAAVRAVERSSIDWLLAGDPAIRWQVMHDIVGADAATVQAMRARVATEGLGSALLAHQAADGRWGGAAWNRGWDSTMHALMLLREFGLDPAGPEARQALTRVRTQVTWRGCAPPECDDHPFFAGEVEPCINGQVAAVGAYFGEDVDDLIGRLLGEQLADGGWNCEAERGSTRGSFHTTMCVLEALLAHERANGPSAAVREARERGEAYLLDRRLFRRRSTGDVIDRDRKLPAGVAADAPAFTRIAVPSWWHYDVLRGLDYFRASGRSPDPRMADAINLLESKRGPDGRWVLEHRWPGAMPVDLGEAVGAPSRWVTLRASRVLRWYAAGR